MLLVHRTQVQVNGRSELPIGIFGVGHDLIQHGSKFAGRDRLVPRECDRLNARQDLGLEREGQLPGSKFSFHAHGKVLSPHSAANVSLDLSGKELLRSVRLWHLGVEPAKPR